MPVAQFINVLIRTCRKCSMSLVDYNMLQCCVHICVNAREIKKIDLIQNGYSNLMLQLRCVRVCVTFPFLALFIPL